MAARRRGRANWLRGFFALTLSLAVLAGAGYAVYSSRQGGGLNPDNLCPAAGPSGHVVLLVDQTDPLNFTQKQAFLAYLAEFGRGKVAPGELFSVFVIAGDVQQHAEPLFAMCNPGAGSDKSVWTANPERWKRQFDSRFLQPMSELADSLLTAKPMSTSPIMEMLQLVAIEGFRQQAVAGPKRLFVVSDMLQNTAAFSHYKADADFQKFSATPRFANLRADLSNVSVELAYLMTAPQRQTRRHAKFWEDYFHAMGAKLVAVRILEG